MMKDIKDTPFRDEQIAAYMQVQYGQDNLDQVTFLSLRCERLESAFAKMKSKAKQFREERDQLKKKLREVQSIRLLQSSNCASCQDIPDLSKIKKIDREAKIVPPSARLAQRVQLKRNDDKRLTVKPAELIRIGVDSTKVAQYLTRDTLFESTLQEELQIGKENLGTEEVLKIKLHASQNECDYLKAQLDVSEITLNESRSLSDHLSTSCAQMESNAVAYQLAVSCAIKSNQAYQYIIVLQRILYEKNLMRERENDVDFDLNFLRENPEMHKILEFVQEGPGDPRIKKKPRKKLTNGREADEGFCSTEPVLPGSSDVDPQSSPASSPEPGTSYEPEMSYEPMSSVSCNTSSTSSQKSLWQQRIELENAVMIQEVMALKEDKADIQAQLYLLEQDKYSVELALKSKLNELQALRLKMSDCEQEKLCHRSNPESQNEIRNKIADLLDALEAVTESNDKQQIHNQEMICDLRYANSVLLNVLDKMRRRFEHKFGRLKEQMDVLKIKYTAQTEHKDYY